MPPHRIPDSFRTWLTEQLRLQNLSQAEGSRRAGLNQNAISDIIIGKVRGLTLNTAQAFARLFDVSLVEVLRQAGYIKGPTNGDELALHELMELAKTLNEDERFHLLEYARWQVWRRRR